MGSKGARPAETASFDLKVGSTPTIVQWDVPLASIRASLRLPLCFQIRQRMLRNGGWWTLGGGVTAANDKESPLSPLASVRSVTTR